jgi:hypothetical protein
VAVECPPLPPGDAQADRSPAQGDRPLARVDGPRAAGAARGIARRLASERGTSSRCSRGPRCRA